MFEPLRLLLTHLVTSGDITFVDAAGTTHRFGDASGPAVTVRLHDRRLEKQLAVDPELAAGEAFMTGRLTIDDGTVYDFLDLMMRNLAQSPLPAWSQTLATARRLTRRLAQFNPPARARHNVSRHYDLDPRLYELFLDADQQYSCAYFDEPNIGLDEAQRRKKRHIAAKLALRPGQHVLDIGCGWGGMALYLATVADARVTGITLSRQQLAQARTRATAAGLAHTVSFEPLDYRQVEGTFDRIVSVGMFEHVGVGHYETYFRTIADRLADDGVALVHTIARAGPPTATNPFIARYIFPGGYIPAMSEILPAIEQASLVVSDVEVLRLHYAQTLRAWRERFMARADEARAIAGEEFVRMWEFYLAGSEASFRWQGLVVVQLQLTRRIDALPLTRGYIADAERRLADAEQETPQAIRRQTATG